MPDDGFAVVPLRASTLLVDFPTEKIVERGSDDGDRAELADRVPARRHRGGQDVSAELEFERDCEESRQRQPDGGEVFYPRRE